MKQSGSVRSKSYVGHEYKGFIDSMFLNRLNLSGSRGFDENAD